MPRTFRTVESQREASRQLALRLQESRLARAIAPNDPPLRARSAALATVEAFTAARLRRYPHGATVAPAYDR